MIACAMGVRAQEIYGVFTQNDEVMTLYYDNQRTSRGGLLIDVWPKTNEFLERGHAVYTVILDASMQDARPTSTQQWFEEFENLENIEHLEYLNTSNVTHMNMMFYACMSLSSLDLSGFNTSKLQNTYMMFEGCSALTQLDLRNFDVSHLTRCSYMFKDCENLETILSKTQWAQYVGSANAEDMFLNCYSLVGGNGTHYSASHTGIEYARPDKPGQPGYFTITGQGIENTNANANANAAKIIRDGQLFIIRDGKTFNALGTELK